MQWQLKTFFSLKEHVNKTLDRLSYLSFSSFFLSAVQQRGFLLLKSNIRELLDTLNNNMLYDFYLAMTCENFYSVCVKNNNQDTSL